MCASEDIIGPISDLIHVSTEEEGEEFDEDYDEENRENRLRDLSADT